MSSCLLEKSDYITREKLFDINYGKLEDEIDITQVRSLNIPISSDITMKDGIFYVINGNLQKIMKFNSYGDLLFVIMNKSLNPDPVIVDNKPDDELVSNRKGIYFPFNDIGKITVDSKQNIFISDLLENTKQEWDAAKETMLTDVVYRFDNKGDFTDYIGQDGPGGMPFPYITSLKSNSENELVVITKTAKTNPVYWFNPAGKLLYQIEISNTSVPLPDDRNILASVDSILIPDTGHRLFIKCDFYKKIINEDTGKETDVDFLNSSIFIMDLDSGKFVSAIEIPEVFTSGGNNMALSEERLQTIYSMLGIVGNDKIFLTAIIDESSYQLLILSTEGNVLFTKKLNIEEETLYNLNMDIDDKGIITAALSDSDKTTVVWWRTDKVIREK